MRDVLEQVFQGDVEVVADENKGGQFDVRFRLFYSADMDASIKKKLFLGNVVLASQLLDACC